MTTTNDEEKKSELTEQQKERIRRNRERALEIRRQKLKEKEEASSLQSRLQSATKVLINPYAKTKSNNDNNAKDNGCPTEGPTRMEITAKPILVDDACGENNSSTVEAKSEEDSNIELEDFEIGASQYVTKEQAMKKYCLPPGTLAVCAFIEKDNPRQPKWSKMKLYHRSEIRRRARERFGGLDGLIEERNKREKKRFERDYKSAHEIFETKKKPKSY